ncbi:MAG: hypothetical protein JXD22_00185 [Sedimentisphaerales bacterium]|nr:hypothetical protein [Sedimentisphaerales bacterium]
MEKVFLERSYIVLLVVHMLVTIVLVGSMTHNFLVVIDYLRGKFNRKNRELLYLKVSLWAYTFVYIVGALIYPAFRIRVRHDYFDEQLPWATGLFEVKEHWAALGMAFIVALYFFRKSFDPAVNKQKLFLYVPLCFIINFSLWYIVIASCFLTILKGS